LTWDWEAGRFRGWPARHYEPQNGVGHGEKRGLPQPAPPSVPGARDEGEEMGIDREGDVGVGVAELAGDEDDVDPLGNEQAGNDDPGVLEGVASPGLI